MDPDCSICKERASPMLFADTERPYQTKRPLYLIYSLLVFSYIMILTLFILVFYKTTFTSSQAEIKSDLRNSTDTDQTFSTYSEKQLTNLGKNIDDILKQDNGTSDLLPKYLSILKILQNQVLAQEKFSSKIQEQLSNNTNDIGMIKKQVDDICIQHPEYLSNLKNLQKQVEELSSRLNKTSTTDENKSCENDWVYFRGSCFLFSTITSDWTQARKACKEEGADLVVITSSLEQRFILSEISVRSSKHYWIGLHDMDEENEWQWVDGTNYTKSYKNWNQGEPNNADDREDCVHTQPNGKWNDILCTYSNNISALCKRKV